MRIPNIYITDKFENLDVRVVGYKSLGESIVVNIGKSFVMVIDSYRCYGKFLTQEILEKELGVEEVNILCWTHPDEDHTLGLGELFEYVGNSTYVIIPQGISSREIESSIRNSDNKESMKEYQDIYSQINNVGSKLIICNEGTSIEFNIIYRSKTYNCKIEFFAPMGYIVRNQEIDNCKMILENKDKSEYLNLYSIAMKLYINDIKLCFTGDLDNEIINCFAENNEYYRNTLIGNNNVFKIPHHGSKNASYILDYINKFDYGIVTTYRRGTKLPNKEMMQEYSKFGKIYSTRSVDPKENYGIVHVQIPIFDSRNSKCFCEYDACKWSLE